MVEPKKKVVKNKVEKEEKVVRPKRKKTINQAKSEALAVVAAGLETVGHEEIVEPTEEFAPKLKKKRRLGLFWKIFITVVLVFVVATSVFSFGLYRMGWSGGIVDSVKKVVPFPAVVINWINFITLGDYEQEVAFIKDVYSKLPAPNGIDFTTDAGKAKLKDYEKQITDAMVRNKIIDLLGVKYGISVSASDIEDQYQQYVQTNGEEAVAKIPAIRAEIKSYLVSQKLSEKVPVQLKLREIFFKVSNWNDKALVAKKKKLADGVIKQLDQGGSFTELAKKLSEDIQTKAGGGDLGYVLKGELTKELETVVFALDKGKYTTVQKINEGYVILLVEDKRGNVDMSFEDWITSETNKATIWRLVKI